MTSPWKPPGPGALDDLPWPENLTANAVEPGEADDRLHGYSLIADLACHYDQTEILYLALKGELPDEQSTRIFRFALTSFAGMSVKEAPAHIGVLSRICGAHFASAIGAGVLALAESARALTSQHAELIAWLALPTGTPPASACSAGNAWTATLMATANTLGLAVPTLRSGLAPDAARLCLLHAAGLDRAEQMEAAIVVAMMTGLAAEALMAGPEQLRLYPVKLPPYHYVPRRSQP